MEPAPLCHPCPAPPITCNACTSLRTSCSSGTRGRPATARTWWRTCRGWTHRTAQRGQDGEGSTKPQRDQETWFHPRAPGTLLRAGQGHPGATASPRHSDFLITKSSLPKPQSWCGHRCQLSGRQFGKSNQNHKCAHRAIPVPGIHPTDTPTGVKRCTEKVTHCSMFAAEKTRNKLCHLGVQVTDCIKYDPCTQPNTTQPENKIRKLFLHK